MNGGELDLLRVLRGGLVVLGLDVGEERELREEVLGALKLEREAGELFEVFEALTVVGEVLLKVIFIARLDDVANHLGWAAAHGFGFKLRDGDDEPGPGGQGLLRHGSGAFLKRGGEGDGGLRVGG